jgi:hypothetical protein
MRRVKRIAMAGAAAAGLGAVTLATYALGFWR